MMEHRRKTDHPIWSVLKLLIICFPLSVFIWKNASTPDWTEIKTIIEFVGVLAGAETFRQARMRLWRR